MTTPLFMMKLAGAVLSWPKTRDKTSGKDQAIAKTFHKIMEEQKIRESHLLGYERAKVARHYVLKVYSPLVKVGRFIQKGFFGFSKRLNKLFYINDTAEFCDTTIKICLKEKSSFEKKNALTFMKELFHSLGKKFDNFWNSELHIKEEIMDKLEALKNEPKYDQMSLKQVEDKVLKIISDSFKGKKESIASGEKKVKGLAIINQAEGALGKALIGAEIAKKFDKKHERLLNGMSTFCLREMKDLHWLAIGKDGFEVEVRAKKIKVLGYEVREMENILKHDKQIPATKKVLENKIYLKKAEIVQLQQKNEKKINGILSFVLPVTLGVLEVNTSSVIRNAIEKSGGMIAKFAPLLDIFGIMRIIIGVSFFTYNHNVVKSGLKDIHSEKERIKGQIGTLDTQKKKDQLPMLKNLLELRQGVLETKKEEKEIKMARSILNVIPILIGTAILTSVLLKKTGVKLSPKMEKIARACNWSSRVIGTGSMLLGLGSSAWYGRHQFMAMIDKNDVAVEKIFPKAQQALLAQKVSVLKGRIKFLEDVQKIQKAQKSKKAQKNKIAKMIEKNAIILETRIKVHKKAMGKMNQEMAALKRLVVEKDVEIEEKQEKWTVRELSIHSGKGAEEISAFRKNLKILLGKATLKEKGYELGKTQNEIKATIKGVRTLIEKENGKTIEEGKLTFALVEKYLQHTPISYSRIETLSFA